MTNCKFLMHGWRAIDSITIGSILATLFVMNYLTSFLTVLVSHISSEQLASYAVPLSEYIAPTIIFSGLMLFAVFCVGMPHRKAKIDLISTLAAVLIWWLVSLSDFFFFQPPENVVLMYSHFSVFTIVRVFGSIWLSWLFSLLLLLVVGLGAYAGLAWKRRRILKGKVVPHYWWDDDDLPCLLTEGGCYFWDREEKSYKFAMYEDVASDEK